MRCKNIELLIIEASERELNEEERSVIEQHTSRCPECRQFREEFEKIHLSLKKHPSPSLSEGR